MRVWQSALAIDVTHHVALVRLVAVLECWSVGVSLTRTSVSLQQQYCSSAASLCCTLAVVTPLALSDSTTGPAACRTIRRYELSILRRHTAAASTTSSEAVCTRSSSDDTCVVRAGIRHSSAEVASRLCSTHSLCTSASATPCCCRDRASTAMSAVGEYILETVHDVTNYTKWSNEHAHRTHSLKKTHSRACRSTILLLR